MANASGGGWGRLRLFLELHLCLGLSLGDLVDRLDAANQLALLSEDRHRKHLPRHAHISPVSRLPLSYQSAPRRGHRERLLCHEAALGVPRAVEARVVRSLRHDSDLDKASVGVKGERGEY